MKYLNNLGVTAASANTPMMNNPGMTMPMANQPGRAPSNPGMTMPMTNQQAKAPMANAPAVGGKVTPYPSTYQTDTQMAIPAQGTVFMQQEQMELTPAVPTQPLSRQDVLSLEGVTDDMAIPETLLSVDFVPGFLRTQIGKTMRVVFFIGNQLTDRVGVLIGVGASYILLQEVSTTAVTMCDLFSIKFVTIMDLGEINPILYT